MSATIHELKPVATADVDRLPNGCPVTKICNCIPHRLRALDDLVRSLADGYAEELLAPTEVLASIAAEVHRVIGGVDYPRRGEPYHPDLIGLTREGDAR